MLDLGDGFCHLGGGEPQFQLVPALFDLLMRKLHNLPEVESAADEKAAPIEIEWILKSDGMGKQKNVGLRAIRLMQDAMGDHFSDIQHNRKRGTSSILYRGYRLKITVCIHFSARTCFI